MTAAFSLKQALLLLGLCMIWVLAVLAALYYFQVQLGFSLEALVHGGIITLVVLFLLHQCPSNDFNRFFAPIALTTTRPRFVVVGLACGLTLWGLDHVVSVFILREDSQQEARAWHTFAEAQGFISTSISACILAPLAEEMVFRGVLLPALAVKVGIGLAVLISAVLFALIHLSPSDAFVLLTAGFVFGLLRTRTGSLWPPIVAHATNNIVTWSAFTFGWEAFIWEAV